MFLSDGHVAAETGCHHSFAHDVVDIQQVGDPVVRGRDPTCVLVIADQGAHRFVVNPRRRNRHQLGFGIAQCGEPSAKDATGINIDGAVQPRRFSDRRVSINDRGPTPVAGGPVGADGQAPFVRLSSGFAVQAEVPDPGGGPPLVLFLHSRVGDHQISAVQHVVADQAVHELRGPFPELRRFQL